MAVALMFGVQSVDLRTYTIAGHYDARATLSPATRDLYMAVRNVVGRSPSGSVLMYGMTTNKLWIYI